MKDIKILLCLLCISVCAYSQITLHSTYDYYELYHGKFENAGDKIIYVDVVNYQVILYNLDQTVYKVLVVPPIFDGFQVSYITEALFDADISDFEYVLTYWKPDANNFNYKPQTYIYDEAGNQLFFRDSMSVTWTTRYTDGFIDNGIWETADGTIMKLGSVSGMYNTNKSELYLLPGSF